MLKPVHQEVVKTTPKMAMVDRLRMIRERVYEIAVEHCVGDVAAEQYNIGPKKRSSAAQTYYLHGQVGMRLAEGGFPPPLMIAPPTLKKWITGAGSAEKSDMREALEEHFGCKLHNDHNVIDAIGLGTMIAYKHRHAAALFSPSKYQLEKMNGWQRML